MMTIRWSEEAIKDYHQNIEYFLSNWSGKIAKRFIEEVELVLSLIQEHPYLYPQTNYEEIRKAVIREQISLFYLVQEDQILLVRFWNNYQNPKNLES